MCALHSGVRMCCRPVATPTPTLPQESCARVLLFRGANKDVRNYNSQTAFQVHQCLQEHEAAPRRVCLFVCGLVSLDLAFFPCRVIREL